MHERCPWWNRDVYFLLTSLLLLHEHMSEVEVNMTVDDEDNLCLIVYGRKQKHAYLQFRVVFRWGQRWGSTVGSDEARLLIGWDASRTACARRAPLWISKDISALSSSAPPIHTKFLLGNGQNGRYPLTAPKMRFLASEFVNKFSRSDCLL